MRKSMLSVLSVILLSAVAYADDRHQSYISYEEGQAVVRQDDGREVEARVNVPVFPGDEIETGRRGRNEIRLADGNIFAVDRSSLVRFKSILDAYDGDANETVVELAFGTAMVHAIDDDSYLRIDTSNATYVARARSLFSVNSGQRGSDSFAVFSGSVEVRTPDGTERVRAGERVRVDSRGIYGEDSVASYGDTDFERWYIRRAERYGRSSRYLDRRIAYADYDLDGYGNWVYVNDYDSWAWRPHVSVGWRPYHYGRWGHRFGSLVWISDEPWGWVPYHYGRWAYSPVYSWLWVPGAAYSHAWVYWAFGPSYIGWIPAGWYDCYRPYYPWAYQPYRGGVSFGFGFHGRVRLANIDHRAWTFVDPNTLLSTRTDRATLTTEVLRDRLARDGDRALVSNVVPKLTRDQLKDPSTAIGVIARREAGSGTGKDGSGSLTDLTPFFRRDPELPSSIRARVAPPIESARPNVNDRREGSVGAPRGDTGGIVRREGRTGSVGTVPRRETGGETSPHGSEGGVITRRVPGRSSPGSSDDDDDRVITRRPRTETPEREPSDSGSGSVIRRQRESGPSPAIPDDGWRGRSIRRETPSDSTPRPEGDRSIGSAPNWRERGDSGRVSRPDRSEGSGRSESVAPRSRDRADDIPRRVIDRIGGARLEPSDRSSSRSRPEAGSRDSGSRSSVPREVSRPSSPPPQQHSSPPSQRSSAPKDSGSSNMKPHKSN